MYTFIHSFIHLLPLIRTTSGHGEPVPISGVIGHQGRIHPGRSANPSQGTHTHTHTLIHSHNHTLRTIFQRCQSTYHVCLWTGGGNRSTRRKPQRHGENMQTPHTQVPGGNHRGTGRTCKHTHTHKAEAGIEPQPWRCEANVLTTKPPCPLTLILIKKILK
ncbi:hypothetical protein Q7C36_013864 [Tachysurus vachellii]|uniref:Secreted protein n=1 Tax=Tachysurus vachellii TaxID=175792 RepID=A0AA88MIN5_TACVA|nr:hypothetical protein Q7C36_013864 [Tachysurus vachellii]